MCQPGAIEIDTPMARTFPCGHRWELRSGNARRMWGHSGRCPACAVRRPQVRVLITRVERRTGGGAYDWFPGVKVGPVEPQEAQGRRTGAGVTALVQGMVDALTEAHGFRFEDQEAPGLYPEETADRKRVVDFVRVLRGLPVIVSVSGQHAHRFGLLEG